MRIASRRKLLCASALAATLFGAELHASTVQIAWECRGDGVIRFYARNTLTEAQENVGSLIIDGVEYPFTGSRVTRNINVATGVGPRLGSNTIRWWQVVDVEGLENGLHSFDVTGGPGSVEGSPPGFFPQNLLILCVVANAGEDQVLDHTSCDGTLVQLDGSLSVPSDGSEVENAEIVLYEWFVDCTDENGDPSVILDDPHSVTPSGLFPVGVTTVMLTVTDSIGVQASDCVSIEILNQDPVAVIAGGVEQVFACTSHDGTPVELDGSGSFDPDVVDELQFEWLVAAGSGATLDDPGAAVVHGAFPPGPTLVTLIVTDGCGGMAIADVLVTVVDETLPVALCTTDCAELWPPDHQMVPVRLALVASDECTAPEDLVITCTIASNEPDDGRGDGSSTGDVGGQDGFASPAVVQTLVLDPVTGLFETEILLRAERDGKSSSRVYSILCTVTDESGNVSTASCVVLVPHDRRKN